MSGVFGVINNQNSSSDRAQLLAMGDTLVHRPWYQVDTFYAPEAGGGVGRVGIGILNAEPQPSVSEDESIILCMAGEFYYEAEPRRQLVAQGYHFRDFSQAELALRLYQAYGPDFVRSVEGLFVIAIWDRRHRQLVLLNDRFGLKPIYYSQINNKFTFAPEIKAILADPACPRSLNLTAIAEYLRFQQLLGQKNFFEAIHLLPPASILTVELSPLTLSRQTYWDWSQFWMLENKIDDRELAEEGERLLRRAVNARLERADRPGVFLSGGLDSRAILAVTDPKYQPITTITYGHRDCRDATLAARIARMTGTNHHFFEFEDGRWVKEVVDFHLELTEGAHSWLHTHGMSILPQARQLIDVNLSGISGILNAMVAEPGAVYAPDQDTLVNKLFLFLNQRHTWPGLTEPEAWHLYTPAYQKTMQHRALESLRQEVEKSAHLDMRLRAIHFNLVNRDRRFIGSHLVFASSHFEVRCPFYDYQLVDWAIPLPQSQRATRQVHYSIIERASPRLALIPRDKDYRLTTTNQFLRNIHALYDRLSQHVRGRLGLHQPRQTLYADYENYLRYELRDWAEGILLDERTLDRGIFRREALRSLMDRHLDGHEVWTIGKLAPLITLEMVLRRFFDEDLITP